MVYKILLISQRILESVEQVAVSAHDDAPPGAEYKVRNAKPNKATPHTNILLNDLKENSHFYHTPVNATYSSVHIPTYVYDRGKSNTELQLGIQYVYSYTAVPKRIIMFQ